MPNCFAASNYNALAKVGHANFLACGDLIPIMLSLAFEYAGVKIDIRAKSLL